MSKVYHQHSVNSNTVQQYKTIVYGQTIIRRNKETIIMNKLS